MQKFRTLGQHLLEENYVSQKEEETNTEIVATTFCLMCGMGKIPTNNLNLLFCGGYADHDRENESQFWCLDQILEKQFIRKYLSHKVAGVSLDVSHKL